MPAWKQVFILGGGQKGRFMVNEGVAGVTAQVHWLVGPLPRRVGRCQEEGQHVLY